MSLRSERTRPGLGTRMSLRERTRPDWSHKRPLSIPGVMMLRTLAYKFLGMFSPNPKRSFLHTLLLCAVVVCTTVLCAVVLYGATEGLWLVVHQGLQ